MNKMSLQSAIHSNLGHYRGVVMRSSSSHLPRPDSKLRFGLPLAVQCYGITAIAHAVWSECDHMQLGWAHAPMFGDQKVIMGVSSYK